VSTQTLDNLVALDRVVSIPVLRPLLTFDKTAIRQRAEAIGTYDLSARTRELCDISGGARVATSMRHEHLRGVGSGLEDLIADAVASAKRTRLADWMPGTHYGHDH
jgi:adenylyl- and sulfurtransferase ThiI